MRNKWRMHDEGKETEEELELVLDEADTDILTGYLNRISSVLKGSFKDNLQSLSSVESLAEQVERLQKENLSMQSQLAILKKLDNLDDFTKTILFDKISEIVMDAKPADIKEFIDYLDIFEKYRKFERKE